MARKEFEKLSEDSSEKAKLKHQIGKCERWLTRKAEFEGKYLECLNVTEDLQICLVKHMLPQILADFEMLMEDLNQLPFIMKKEKPEIKICQWLLDSLSLVTGLKQAGIEAWADSLKRAEKIFAQRNPNNYLLEKLNTQVILHEKLQVALRELHLVEKVVEKMEEKERAKLRTIEEIEKLREALDKCEVDLNEEKYFVNGLYEKARAIRSQRDSFKNRKQRTFIADYQSLLQEMIRLPFQLPEETSLRKLVKRSLKMSQTLNESQMKLNAEELGKTLEIYKMQSVAFLECEKILENYERALRLLETVEPIMKEDSSCSTYRGLKEAYFKLDEIWEGPFEKRIKNARITLFSLLVELLKRVWDGKGNYYVYMPFEEFLQIENESRLLKEKYGEESERFKKAFDFLRDVKAKAEERKLEIIGFKREEEYLAVLRSKKKTMGFISWVNEITEGLMNFGHKGTFQIDVEEGYSKDKSLSEILMEEEEEVVRPVENEAKSKVFYIYIFYK